MGSSAFGTIALYWMPAELLTCVSLVLRANAYSLLAQTGAVLPFLNIRDQFAVQTSVLGQGPVDFSPCSPLRADDETWVCDLSRE